MNKQLLKWFVAIMCYWSECYCCRKFIDLVEWKNSNPRNAPLPNECAMECDSCHSIKWGEYGKGTNDTNESNLCDIIFFNKKRNKAFCQIEFVAALFMSSKILLSIGNKWTPGHNFFVSLTKRKILRNKLHSIRNWSN